MEVQVPTLSLGKLFCLVGEIGSILDKEGIHLSIRQLIFIAIVWYRQTNAYEVKSGIVFYTPRGVPQMSIHDRLGIQSRINTLIEQRLDLKPG